MSKFELLLLVCNLLEHSTYQSHRVIKTCHNGKDEILLDIQRPGNNGWELVVLKVNEGEEDAN